MNPSESQIVEGEYFAPDEPNRVSRFGGRQCPKCKWRFGPLSAWDNRCVQCKGHLNAATDIEGVVFRQWESRRVLPPYAQLGDEIVYVGYGENDVDSPMGSITSEILALMKENHP